mmetsp:Transcript_100467/g.290195  ORF Transcript_100467/g.290195 Transcript_100467/m.290195 type:complete len:297 (-) Transcript_100467:2708-3598(-)
MNNVTPSPPMVSLQYGSRRRAFPVNSVGVLRDNAASVPVPGPCVMSSVLPMWTLRGNSPKPSMSNVSAEMPLEKVWLRALRKSVALPFLMPRVASAVEITPEPACNSTHNFTSILAADPSCDKMSATCSSKEVEINQNLSDCSGKETSQRSRSDGSRPCSAIICRSSCFTKRFWPAWYNSEVFSPKPGELTVNCAVSVACMISFVFNDGLSVEKSVIGPTMRASNASISNPPWRTFSHVGRGSALGIHLRTSMSRVVRYKLCCASSSFIHWKKSSDVFVTVQSARTRNSSTNGTAM